MYEDVSKNDLAILRGRILNAFRNDVAYSSWTTPWFHERLTRHCSELITPEVALAA